MAIKVSLRKKEVKKNRHSLYLDFYPAIPHPKTGKPTRRDFLGLYVFDKPKNPTDKLHNKETLQIAEQYEKAEKNIKLNMRKLKTLFNRAGNLKQIRMRKVSLIFILLFGFSCISIAQTITIGSQVWMTKNLDVSTFRNGDPIPQAKTEEEWYMAKELKRPAWCYYDNDPKNGAIYGKLYNWFAVNDPRGLAPNGFHIPSDAEWTILTDYLGGQEIAGTKMKSNSGWEKYGKGTNQSGFSGLPGGSRSTNGTFNYIGYFGYWWSSTDPIFANAWCRFLYFNYGNVGRNGDNKRSGFSVRCVKD